MMSPPLISILSSIRPFLMNWSKSTTNTFGSPAIFPLRRIWTVWPALSVRPHYSRWKLSWIPSNYFLIEKCSKSLSKTIKILLKLEISNWNRAKKMALDVLHEKSGLISLSTKYVIIYIDLGNLPLNFTNITWICIPRFWCNQL